MLIEEGGSIARVNVGTVVMVHTGTKEKGRKMIERIRRKLKRNGHYMSRTKHWNTTGNYWFSFIVLSKAGGTA